jgi:hypothetical protein
MSFDVLFLEGLNLLSSGYRESLSELGYCLHDMERSYRKLRDQYSQLARFGEYEQNCFLRWLVIQDFCGKAPFVHYDADIVFNTTPEQIEAEFAGLTFMLQGCPAYTRVEDAEWLENYQAELNLFVTDIEVYSADAWQQRSSFATTTRERNGALWDRHILSSDQDFMQFLTLSGRLPNANAIDINEHCTMALFQNPIGIGGDIHLPLPLSYERCNGVDYIGGRKVAFWHMQNDFSSYLGYATFLKQLGTGSRVPWVRRHPGGWENRPLSYLGYRALTRFTNIYNREPLIRRYFGANSDDLSFLLNSERFWQPGVFEPSKPSKPFGS